MRGFLEAIILTYALSACKSPASSEVRSDQLSSDSFQLVKDADFERAWKGQILPFMEKGEKGYFQGNGHKLEYFKADQPDAKANVIVVHGFGQNYRSFAEVLYTLHTNGYSVNSYSHFGHGCSEHPLLSQPEQAELQKAACQNFTVKRFGHTYYKNHDYCKIHIDEYMTYVKDLKSFVDNAKKEGKKNFLYCHSMGGGICSRFLQEYPNAVDAAFFNAPMLEVKAPLPRWAVNILLGPIPNDNWAPTHGEIPYERFTFEKSADTTSRIRFKANSEYSSIDTGRFRCGGTSKQGSELLKLTDDALRPENMAKVSVPLFIASASKNKDRWVGLNGIEKFCKGVKGCEHQNFGQSMHEIYSEPDPIRLPLLNKLLNFYRDQAD